MQKHGKEYGGVTGEANNQGLIRNKARHNTATRSSGGSSNIIGVLAGQAGQARHHMFLSIIWAGAPSQKSEARSKFVPGLIGLDVFNNET